MWPRREFNTEIAEGTENAERPVEDLRFDQDSKDSLLQDSLEKKKGAYERPPLLRKPELLLCSSLYVRVFLLETLDSSCSVQQLLLAGEKRVAVRADFDAQHVTFDGGASGESVPTGAMHGNSVIIWVNSRLHDSPF